MKKASPRQRKRGKIPLLPNNVDKKNVNDEGPPQGHANTTESNIVECQSSQKGMRKVLVALLVLI